MRDDEAAFLSGLVVMTKVDRWRHNWRLGTKILTGSDPACLEETVPFTCIAVFSASLFFLFFF